MTALRNWAGNYEYQAAAVHRPTTVPLVQEIVGRSQKVKALGSRHSFNDIADTAGGDLISLEHLNWIDEPDGQRMTVTIGGGVKYGPLCRHLYERRYALHNLASLPHISVAGACATATHGSGDRNGNLATAVSAMEIVTADGTLRRFSRDSEGELFNGMVVHLGALGVVTKLTLDIVPAFSLRQDVYENLPLPAIEEHFDEITSAVYSVSLFTDWTSGRFNQVWLKQRLETRDALEAKPTWFGATLAKSNLHPIASISPVNCTQQMGVAGPWHERLPHFRMEFTPSSGEELQTDYLVPRQHAIAALRAINRLRDSIAPLLHISEIRTVAADNLWMSPCYQQDCVSIHFTWKQDGPAVSALLPIVEQELAPLSARPHWGKLFAMRSDHLLPMYENSSEFLGLLSFYDHSGKFCNPFLESNLDHTPPLTGT